MLMHEYSIIYIFLKDSSLNVNYAKSHRVCFGQYKDSSSMLFACMLPGPKIGGGGVTLPICAVIKLDWAVINQSWAVLK